RMNPNELKTNLLELDKYIALKEQYEEHFKNVSPLIQKEFDNLFDDSLNINADINAKVALVEEYSKLSDEQKNNLNMKEFVNAVIDKNNKISEHTSMEVSKGGNIDSNKNVKDRAESVIDSLIDVVRQMDSASLSRGQDQNKDSTKTFRRRGTDGRSI